MGEVETFRIDAIDHLGIPIVDATYTGPNGAYGNGLGYGATALEAEVGAYGEMYEELYVSESARHMRPVKGSFMEMCKTKGDDRVIDPLTLVLPAGSDYGPEMELMWVEINRLEDDRGFLGPF